MSLISSFEYFLTKFIIYLSNHDLLILDTTVGECCVRTGCCCQCVILNAGYQNRFIELNPGCTLLGKLGYAA